MIDYFKAHDMAVNDLINIEYNNKLFILSCSEDGSVKIIDVELLEEVKGIYLNEEIIRVSYINTREYYNRDDVILVVGTISGQNYIFSLYDILLNTSNSAYYIKDKDRDSNCSINNKQRKDKDIDYKQRKDNSKKYSTHNDIDVIHKINIDNDLYENTPFLKKNKGKIELKSIATTSNSQSASKIKLLLNGFNEGLFIIWNLKSILDFIFFEKGCLHNMKQYLLYIDNPHHDVIQIIEFNKMGTGFITGSVDGFVHVWKINPEFKHGNHKRNLVFLENSHQVSVIEDSFSVQSHCNKEENKENKENKEKHKQIKPSVNVSAWSCRNTYIFAVISFQNNKKSMITIGKRVSSLIVYDYNNLKVKYSIGHDNGLYINDECYLLEPHPTNEDLVLLSCDVNEVMIFDIKQRRSIFKFHIKNYFFPDIDDPLLILEGKFIGNGDKFLVSTFLGSVSFFSNVPEKAFEMTYMNQFFENELFISNSSMNNNDNNDNNTNSHSQYRLSRNTDQELNNISQAISNPYHNINEGGSLIKPRFVTMLGNPYQFQMPYARLKLLKIERQLRKEGFNHNSIKELLFNNYDGYENTLEDRREECLKELMKFEEQLKKEENLIENRGESIINEGRNTQNNIISIRNSNGNVNIKRKSLSDHENENDHNLYDDKDLSFTEHDENDDIDDELDDENEEIDEKDNDKNSENSEESNKIHKPKTLTRSERLKNRTKSETDLNKRYNTRNGNRNNSTNNINNINISRNNRNERYKNRNTNKNYNEDLNINDNNDNNHDTNSIEDSIISNNNLNKLRKRLKFKRNDKNDSIDDEIISCSSIEIEVKTEKNKINKRIIEDNDEDDDINLNKHNQPMLLSSNKLFLNMNSIKNSILPILYSGTNYCFLCKIKSNELIGPYYLINNELTNTIPPSITDSLIESIEYKENKYNQPIFIHYDCLIRNNTFLSFKSNASHIIDINKSFSSIINNNNLCDRCNDTYASFKCKGNCLRFYHGHKCYSSSINPDYGICFDCLLPSTCISIYKYISQPGKNKRILDRTAFESKLNNIYSFYPQIGSEFIFIPQAYEDYLSLFHIKIKREMKEKTGNDSIFFWRNFKKTKCDYEKESIFDLSYFPCSIQRMSFHFSNDFCTEYGIYIKISLVFNDVAVISKDNIHNLKQCTNSNNLSMTVSAISTRRQISNNNNNNINNNNSNVNKSIDVDIIFFPDNNVPDFLIEKELYYSNKEKYKNLDLELNLNKMNNDIKVYFENSFYSVKLIDNQPKEKNNTYKSSCFERFEMEVLYDTHNSEKEISNFSFWDILNNDSINKSSQISTNIRNKYLLNMNKALKNNTYSIFFDKVSSDLFPDYYEFVPVLINLNLIKERLENNYYSNEMSFIFDLELIINNSIIYNGEDDEITLLAKTMKNEILSLSKRKENKNEINLIKEVDIDFVERRNHNLLSNKRRRDNHSIDNNDNSVGIISTRRRQQLK